MTQKGPTQDEVVKAAFKYQPALVSYAFAMLRDWELAKDAVQDAYLVVMKKWQEYRPGTNVYSWARRIVHFKVMETLRARKAEIPVEEEALEDLVHEVVQQQMDEGMAERQILMRKALEKCMFQLQQGGVKLLSGFYAERKSCDVLAKIHRRSVEAVRMALSRLRDRLRKCVLSHLQDWETAR
ncbi:MAG: sigma-70 family RNA polymerase sigma factor [Kiritimatiellae bacterium]|nr:sigma-70 family RNA polymerase sigma factor [Kiritimatiellia bacterium]